MTSDADSLADAALFDKLSLSEVDFDTLSFAEAALLSAVLLLADSLATLLKLLLFDTDVLRLADLALSLFAADADSLTALLSESLFTSDADSLADFALFDKLSLSEVDFDALSLAEADLLSDSLANFTLFDKLSLSEVDFDALSFAEVEADLLPAVLLLADSLAALLVLVL